MSLSESITADPLVQRALANVDARLAKARLMRPPQRYTRRALTVEQPIYSAISYDEPEFHLKPLQPRERKALYLALEGTLTARHMERECGISDYSASAAISALKCKLKARGIAFADNRRLHGSAGRMVIIDRESARAFMEGRMP